MRNLFKRFPFNVRMRLRDVEAKLYDLERCFDKMLVHPRYQSSDPAFNDQEGRHQIFAALMQVISF